MRRDGSSTDADYNRHYGVFFDTDARDFSLSSLFLLCVNIKALSYECTADVATLYIILMEGTRCSVFAYEPDIKHEACLGSLWTDW